MKDLIIGLDIYKQLMVRLRVVTQGISIREKLKLYAIIIRLFLITNVKQIKNVEHQLMEQPIGKISQRVYEKP